MLTILLVAPLFLVLLIEVGRFKTEESVFDMQFDEHGAVVTNDVVVTFGTRLLTGLCRQIAVPIPVQKS